jgi:DNA-binding HxlR family transcriptional regulator
MDEQLSDSIPHDPWSAKLAPIIDLFDVLGRRWAMRILWELTTGPATFRGLMERADPISSSVLTDRLRELRQAGLVEHERSSGYRLSIAGQGVAERITALYVWLANCDDWPARPT